jgi:hypothetical protein
MELEETREFGTGLRDHLEYHGVRMDARGEPASNADLLELTAVAERSSETGGLTLRSVPLTA